VDSSYTAHKFDEKNYIAVAAYLESLQDFTFCSVTGYANSGCGKSPEFVLSRRLLVEANHRPAMGIS
jgi:hypothetical protein